MRSRRLPGASAYVELAGSDHEIGTRGNPLPAVDAHRCLRLVESARERWPGTTLPDVPAPGSERDLAKRFVAEDFVRTGIDRTLTPDEAARRAEEAANVIIQLLDETGLLVPSGDLTAPEDYSLPQGAMRRVLAGQPSLSAFPSARLAP